MLKNIPEKFNHLKESMDKYKSTVSSFNWNDDTAFEAGKIYADFETLITFFDNFFIKFLKVQTSSNSVHTHDYITDVKDNLVKIGNILPIFGINDDVGDYTGSKYSLSLRIFELYHIPQLDRQCFIRADENPSVKKLIVPGR